MVPWKAALLGAIGVWCLIGAIIGWLVALVWIATLLGFSGGEMIVKFVFVATIVTVGGAVAGVTFWSRD